jgi:hypothetical protein
MTCSNEKLATDFYVRNKVTMVRHSSCKECDKARVKARHQENPERTRNNDLKDFMVLLLMNIPKCMMNRMVFVLFVKMKVMVNGKNFA